MKKFLTLACCFFLIVTQAQEKQGSITGVIIDQVDKAVEAATVQLLQQETKAVVKVGITDKAEKLSTFYDGIINCEVTLRLDKSSNSENKIAEIKLLGAAKALQYAYRGCVPPGPEPVLPVP